jgi:hypothetical protein
VSVTISYSPVQSPDKIPDAPDLVDDYDLNLLDWSANNTVAIALGSSVYLWNAATGKGATYCARQRVTVGGRQGRTCDNARTADGDPHYKVTLRVEQEALTGRQKNLEIRPGMQADVELQTGGKTVLTYLTKPLYKSNEALRER